jgi:peptide/nickel transport system permease protein
MTVGVAEQTGGSNPLRDAFAILRENPLSLLAAVFLVVLLVVGLLASWIAPFDPLATNSLAALSPPGSEHLFGTDQLGRDIFSRVLHAIALELAIAFGAVAASFLIGSAAGCASGFFGGATDWIVGRTIDVLMAFPLFVLAIGIVAALGNSIVNVCIATAIVNIPFYARTCRAEAMVMRNADFVEAARLAGAGSFRILLMHVLPNILPILVVQISLNMGWPFFHWSGCDAADAGMGDHGIGRRRVRVYGRVVDRLLSRCRADAHGSELQYAG